MEIAAQQPEYKIVALVRNKDGQPQFNDFSDIPEEYHSALTEEDWIYINEMRNN
jgi:hypothetical protein